MDKSTPDPRPHSGRPDAAPAPQSEQDAPPGFLGTTFASLAYRNFVYLWFGQITHAGALWIDMVARPLLVLAVTDSAVHLGLVMSARTVPAIALGLFAGVLADNFNRRMMLLATKVIVFGFGTLFALLLFFGLLELWHIYLFTFLRGATQAFDQPARRALVPSAVPRHLVTNAMALSAGTVQIMRIAGAGAAGVIIAGAGIEVAFLVIAALYGAAAYVTWMLRTPDHRRQAYRGVGGIGADLVQGLRYGWNDRVVRGMLIISAGYFTFGMAFMQVFAPLFAKRVLEIGDSGFGWMMAVTGAGGVVGAFMLAGLNPRTKRGQMTTALLGILGLLLVAFALSTYWGPVGARVRSRRRAGAGPVVVHPDDKLRPAGDGAGPDAGPRGRSAEPGPRHVDAGSGGRGILSRSRGRPAGAAHIRSVLRRHRRGHVRPVPGDQAGGLGVTLTPSASSGQALALSHQGRRDSRRGGFTQESAGQGARYAGRPSRRG